MSDDPDNDQSIVVDGFLKSRTEMVVGEIAPYKGKLFAHVRIMVPSAEEEGEWIRTQKGVHIEVERVPELLDAVRKLLDVAALERVVARLPAGREEIWVGVNPFQGNQYVYVRRFYQDKKSAEWRPTPKGVSIRSELVTKLVQLIDDLAEEVSRALGGSF